jgi:hypothetical protein
MSRRWGGNRRAASGAWWDDVAADFLLLLAAVAPYNFVGGARMKFSTLVACAAALLVTGCKLPEPDKKLAAIERATFEAVRTGDGEAMAAVSVPQLQTPAAVAEIAKVRTYLPQGAPKASKLVGWNVNFGTDGAASAFMASDHDYGDRVVLARTSMRRAGSDSPWLVEGFHVQVATDAELGVNDFSLVGKKPGQYLFLLAAAASLASMVAALVKVVRTPGLRRKWLWGIAAFVGIVKVQMNWATGVVGFNLFSVQLIGATATTGLSRFEPWIINTTLPIGAVLILAGVWANPAKAKPRAKKPQDAF